ncbi:MAG TPA: tyrosine-type recombinase/integrase, partial [Isosphaeraceae bacterium]|nr:tyrosine-type recombinase/integrase [Isosphaeraceae bacterium]
MAEKLIKRGKVWYYRFTDANGKRVMRRGCTDKRATEEMARAAEIEAAKIRAGLIDPKEAAYRGHEAKPLADHLADWRAFLLGRDRSRRHADEGHARVAKLMTLAKADRLSDLVLTRVQAALAALRDEGLSLRTVHHYARLVKNFTKWAWRDGRTREDLLAHLQPPDNPESDRRRVRRALTVPELARLIEAAESGPVRRQLSGIDRAMLYRITAGTGFRSEEMQSLTPESFDLDGSCPTITVEAADSKRRRRDVQPIQPALASLLRPWLAGRPQSQPVFPVDRWAILEALKADEAAAGIAYKNEEGFADFHALRHTYLTLGGQAGIDLRTLQELAGHSTPALTARY